CVLCAGEQPPYGRLTGAAPRQRRPPDAARVCSWLKQKEKANDDNHRYTHARPGADPGETITADRSGAPDRISGATDRTRACFFTHRAAGFERRLGAAGAAAWGISRPPC